MRILLHHGASPHFQNDFWDPLATAAWLGHESLINLFLKLGLDPDGDRNGRSPLSYAAERGDVEAVKLLLGAHADTESDGKTSLSRAAEKGHLAVVRQLF